MKKALALSMTVYWWWHSFPFTLPFSPTIRRKFKVYLSSVFSLMLIEKVEELVEWTGCTKAQLQPPVTHRSSCLSTLTPAFFSPILAALLFLQKSMRPVLSDSQYQPVFPYSRGRSCLVSQLEETHFVIQIEIGFLYHQGHTTIIERSLG